jgi:hypothetical protein
VEPDIPYTPAQNDEDEGIIELKPRRGHIGDNDEKSPKPVLKAVAGLLAIAVLFGLSVGLGVYSNYRDAQKAQKGANDVTSIQQLQTATASAGQGSGLSVEQANDSMGYATPTSLSKDSPYYQYTDVLNGAELTISRQPLPDEYKNDPEGAFNRLATSLKATESISTRSWGRARMLTDGKNSVQVVVFKNSSKLVIIQSKAVHSADTWAQYINSHSF